MYSSNRQLYRYAAVAGVFLISLLLLWRASSPYRSVTPPHSRLSSTTDYWEADSVHDFWTEFADLLQKWQPTCPRPTRVKTSSVTEIGVDKGIPSVPRPDLLRMPDSDVQSMKSAHSSFTTALTTLPPLPAEDGTTGIVTTAGLSQLPVLLVSLKMLRRTGSKLPVQIFLSSPTDAVPLLCDALFPALNARCVQLRDIVPTRLPLARYQFKIFAILASSFAHVLFLDADSFPVGSNAPDALFTSEPYASHGLVLFPDYWANIAHSMFYTIASLPEPPHLEPSTESGQLFVQRERYAAALLSAAYYNYHGQWFYPLLGQAGPGEGDKDTFLPGAQVHGLPVWNVRTKVGTYGYWAGSGSQRKFHGVAMRQADAQEDYLKANGGRRTSGEKVGYMFLHANFPKMNALDLFKDGGYLSDKPQRIWSPREDVVEEYGEDIERALFEQIRDVACELEEGGFAGWEGQRLCERATARVVQVYS